MRAAALALAWAAAGRPATVEVSPRGGARRLRETSVTDPSVPGRVRTSAVAVGANLSGCAFVGEVNLGASMDMDVVSDALNHGALAAEAYWMLADEANRPPRCGVYVNGSAGLGRYAVAAHVYDAVDGKGAYYGDAPLRLAPRDLTVDGADRAFATPFHVDPDLDFSGLVKVVPTNNSLIISALGQILTELELSNVTFVFDESQEDWGGGWDDVDAYLLDSWGVVATKLTTEALVADVAVVDASHLLVVASYDPDSCEAEMDALDAGRLAPQAQLFVSCLDGLFAKEIVRGFAGQTERSYEVDASRRRPQGPRARRRARVAADGLRLRHLHVRRLPRRTQRAQRAGRATEAPRQLPEEEARVVGEGRGRLGRPLKFKLHTQPPSHRRRSRGLNPPTNSRPGYL